jgi:medium-chain acyl-[acyl-carrier-protein] hydrolase
MNWIDPHFVPRLRLFCFPHAGGTHSLFEKWPLFFYPEIEVCAIKLPGRGARFKEPMITSMGLLSESIANNIKLLDDLPFAIYGECAGALVGLATARVLSERFDLAPKHLFASNARTPRPPASGQLHQLPDAIFRKEIVARGLFAPEISAEDEAIDFFLPQIRADFELVETFNPAERHPLSCPITTLSRTRDGLANSATFEDWREETSILWTHKVINSSCLSVEDQGDQVKVFLRETLTT